MGGVEEQTLAHYQGAMHKELVCAEVPCVWVGKRLEAGNEIGETFFYY